MKVSLKTVSTLFLCAGIISCTGELDNGEQGGNHAIDFPENPVIVGYSSDTYQAAVISSDEWIAEPADDWIYDVVIASGKNGVANHYYTFVGNLYYNAGGVQTAVSPVFDYATMIGGIADNGGATMTCKLTGDASSNPAFGNGMTTAELAELADDTVSATVLSADQNGNARTDADRIAGACCVK